MNQFTKQFGERILILAVGVFLFNCSQQSLGQSVSPPTGKKAEMIKSLESQIEKCIAQQQLVLGSIEASRQRRQLLQKEVDALTQLGNKMSVSPESYPEVLKTLHSQRIQLSIDLAGIDARYEAIKQAIAQVTKRQVESQAGLLQRLVEIRELELDRLKKLANAAAVSTGVLRDAEIALLDAKTRLAQVASPSGGILGHLNTQLLDTTLQRAETTARLDKAKSLTEDVDAFRTHHSKTENKLNEVMSLEDELMMLHDEKNEGEADINTLKARLENMQPDAP